MTPTDPVVEPKKLRMPYAGSLQSEIVHDLSMIEDSLVAGNQLTTEQALFIVRYLYLEARSRGRKR